ncbi:MAG: CPBP family intramembrane glutamic endopeptidase [bacterium]
MDRVKINQSIKNKQVWYFIVIFFALWTIRELVISRFVPKYELISEALLKTLVWIILPSAFIYLIEKKSPINFLKLDTFPKKAASWSVVLGLAYVVGAIFFNGPSFKISTNLEDWLNGFLLVGIAEEIVFRGYILRKFSELMSFSKANLWQSVLFVLIHVPVWFAQNKGYFPTGSLYEYLSAIIFVFIFAITTGYVTKQTKSLWPAVIFHSLADLAVIVLIYK